MNYYEFKLNNNAGEGYAMGAYSDVAALVESNGGGTITTTSERECRLYTGWSNIPCAWMQYVDEENELRFATCKL